MILGGEKGGELDRYGAFIGRRTSAPDAANSWVSSLMEVAFRRVV